jgi:predicted amidohydrolase YtcJ
MTARRVLHALLVLAAGALSACSLDSRARSGAADVVYRGGVILTMTDTAPRVEALGPAQRVDTLTALKAMTIWPAWQHFEEKSKGSLEVGKLADLVILSADPTAVDPLQIEKIQVLETVKAGRSIYRRRD